MQADQTLVKQLVDTFGRWFEDTQRRADGRMSADLYPYSALFSPIQINRLKIKNRIVMGPMGNVSMPEETGRPSNKMIQYYLERARGGVGLITSGLVPAGGDVDPSFTEPGELSLLPRIDRSRTVFAGWRDLAEGVHAHGAHFFIQLTPGLGRVGSPECLVKKWKLPVSASWNPSFYLPGVPCRPLTDGECRKIVLACGQAAADARACEIDGVYLHGHEGYLLEQLTNPAFNRRRLGRYADWQAFGLDTVREIRARCGDDYPVMYRIDLSLALTETYGERMARVPSLRKFRHERSVEMTLDYMRNLVAAGVDIFDVDLGCYDNWWLPHPPGPMPPGCYLAVAQVVKTFFAQQGVRASTGLEVPVVAVGKLGYPDLAERALREGMCDMVMLARPLLADPEWPNKAYAGRVQEIRPCIGDQEACINEFIHGGHVQCAVNPRTGFEDVLPEPLLPAAHPRRVAVVGAGPAGTLCACTAARRGHTVTLLEQADRVGGMLVPGSAPRIKFDVANYLGYLEHIVEQHTRECGLSLQLNNSATVDTLREGGFDVLVIACGGRPARLPVPGIDLPHVVQAVDLLRDPSRAGDARQVVVVGGGEVGCEAAYLLAYEQGKQVTVVEMLPYFMKEACTANRGYLIHYLERGGVNLWNCTRLLQVEPGQVRLLRNVSPTVPDPYATWGVVLPENVKNPLARPIKVEELPVTLPADLVVVAAGFRPDDGLYEACVRERVAPEVRRIGDAFAPGAVHQATKAGYTAGRSIE